MRTVTQIVVVALIATVAVPLSARFVPGTHPWLDSAGLLQPLTALGIVAAEASDNPGGAGQGARQGGGAGGATSVIAAAVQSQPLSDRITAIGSGRGVQAVEASFQVTGRLTALRVAPGDKVAVGDVIAELDAEAATLSVDQARLVLQDRQKTFDRLRQLTQSGATTAQQRQDAELALRSAELDLQSAERDLSDHRLLAPVNGYVGLVEPQVGDLVAAATPVTRIEDRSSLIVDFSVPERVAALVRIGDPVEASAISTPGKAITGQIVAVDNRLDEASRSLRVRATIANPDDSLRAGMAFQITLVFTGSDHPAVDPLAIQWGGDGAFVWVVRDGKATRVPIRILQRNAAAVLVEAEFQPQDSVVTEGVQALRPGADVTIAAQES